MDLNLFFAVDAYSRPFSNFACLKILRVLPSSDDDDAGSTPFSLYRLVSREYHLGGEGLVIGCGQDCTLALPPEAGLKEKHIQIKWVPGM